MSELTQDEFWFIDVYICNYGGMDGGHWINDIVVRMLRLDCRNAKQLVASLISKKVLSLSPDGRKVKFTDFGLELYAAMGADQKAWDKQGVIKTSNQEKGQILIRAGETFKANRVLRDILRQARNELLVLDPYIGPQVFDLIEDVNPNVRSRLITSDKGPSATITTYRAYKRQYPSVELRVMVYASIHDRFILWDGAMGIHLGHSLKDLGQKDTQLNRIESPIENFKLFEQRWSEANTIEEKTRGADPLNSSS